MFNKKLVFIFGCQRSGTSATLSFLDNLQYIKSYPETNNRLTDRDTSELPYHTIRLNPLDDVKNKINQDVEEYIIVKPLVESQNALKIIEYFPNSTALWLYRNYQDVIASMALKWGENRGVNHLKPIIDGVDSNWRAENLDSNVRQDIINAFNKGITGMDGWGLFWYARNSLFFSQNLQFNKKIILLKYEKIVSDNSYMSNAFMQLGHTKVAQENVWQYNNKSIGKGDDITLSSHVEEMLKSMMAKLDFYAFQGKAIMPMLENR